MKQNLVRVVLVFASVMALMAAYQRTKSSVAMTNAANNFLSMLSPEQRAKAVFSLDDKERTNWYRVAIWGKRADFAAKARKGAYVSVTGPLTIGEYDGKLQLEINASDFDYYMPKQDVQSAVKEHFPGAETVGLDDEIPF